MRMWWASDHRRLAGRQSRKLCRRSWVPHTWTGRNPQERPLLSPGCTAPLRKTRRKRMQNWNNSQFSLKKQLWGEIGCEFQFKEINITTDGTECGRRKLFSIPVEGCWDIYGVYSALDRNDFHPQHKPQPYTRGGMWASSACSPTEARSLVMMAECELRPFHACSLIVSENGNNTVHHVWGHLKGWSEGRPSGWGVTLPKILVLHFIVFLLKAPANNHLTALLYFFVLFLK